ncbi:hypothetical protein AKG08_12145 [Achromobacter piechaudii]|uniref:Uncharacterized protein n=1 Tax=Achromobacter piechaudii TaxID=72556 RepID=A0ABM8L1U3_9BURK|nr:hypothetical protein [Achromobacter piechaudii]KNY10451.1 hypothetical protein AKG08_12145 [Achromobacter piechaudii]CAB3724847.1 hypothetical protein LMG1873_04265 [Achromobacter piechaudii]CAB3898084.1 hypothetical protein LMG2828_04349 [Achromobacter piechaudii]CAB3956972.1 hypothetical protein LMG6103_05012 [Achromobacter piechaudii]
MTATPPDPHARQQDSTTDHDDQASVDAQTLRLREENRALRELLAAQVHLSPRPEPGCVKRIGWWLISAPGAALVGWRHLLGRDDAPRITGRRVGSATLTVLYTLAIYGALVLLVVSWNAPNNGIAGPTAASPVRVPLLPPNTPPLDEEPSDWDVDPTAPAAQSAATNPATGSMEDPASQSTPESEDTSGTSTSPAPAPAPTSAVDATRQQAAPAASESPAVLSDSTVAARPATGPHSTLRITEIPAHDPLAWVQSLQTELDRCAALGFFDRPDCAWAARDQFCEPNNGWGVVKECPARP